MLWKLAQRTFNGGQLDARLGGRTDIAKYFQGASVLKNFIVKRQGCIVKRRGTYKIADLTRLSGISDITNYRLIPFSFENDVGYVIAFLSNGTTNKICVIGKNGELKATITNAPYFGSDFPTIGYAQSGDILYLAHQMYPFARLTRKEDKKWTYEVVNFELIGRTSLPATPTIESVSLEPSGSWSGEGPEKTIYFVATAVKDGVESRPSESFKMTYHTPWPAGGVMRLKIQKQNPKPDYYNIYKKQLSGFGFVGTTEDTVTSSYVTTLGVDKNLTQDFKGRKVPADPADAKGLVGKTKAVNDATDTGYCCGGGVYEVVYDTALDIDAVHLSLGYVWYALADGSTSNCRYYIQYLPCNVDKISCVFTFADGTASVAQELTVPADAKSTIKDNSVTGDPYASSTGAKISEKRAAMAHNISLTWNVQGRAGKKIKKVTFTALKSNGSTATGSFTNMGDGYFAKVNGNPFTLSGYWATFEKPGDGNEFLDEFITPDASLTPPVYEPHFEDTGKYPGCVAVYQQRLGLARTIDRPFTFWLSCVGDLYNFNTHENIREDDALEVTLPATKYPDINHMVLNRDLIMFCDSGEWIVSPLSGNTLTYQTISTKIQSQLGCSKELTPIIVGDDVIFANMTNETLVAIKYSYATDGYEATDLSVLSQDLFRGNPITSMAYKQHPDSIIVVTLADGTFATLEYMKEHEVVAWSHHELGGGYKALYCCADGSVTDGTTDVYILAQKDNGNLILLCVKPDSALQNDESAASLDLIEKVAKGASVPAGYTAVEISDTEKVIGLPFSATFVSVKPEPNGNETVRNEIKNPTEFEVTITEGSDIKVGQLGQDRSMDRLIKIPDFETYDKAIVLAGANNKDGRIIVTSETAKPLTILSMATTYQIEQANEEPRRGGGNGD